jgi:aspartyl-tRNA(Asn)/glutamyl-tRNA(Gln) amidotransferase subunit A
MSKIGQFGAEELVSRYRTRDLSPVEVARDLIARRDALEPAINAFCATDDEGLLAAARASEARWTKGEPCGALDGVPVSVKDNINLAGMTCFRGSAVSSREPAPEDAPAVARLREAGALFVGKTTMPEYGWKGVGDSPMTGITRNPWNTSRNPGGSTSGGAAAAALNLGVIHIGTDGAGSVRIPAAFCGVFGIKPSYGRIPAFPASVMGFLAHLGPLTRNVADAALALQVLGQPDRRDMTAMITPPPDYRKTLENGLKGLRIACSPRLRYVKQVESDIARLTEAAARRFTELGAVVEEADPGFEDPIATLNTLWCAGAAVVLRAYNVEEQAKMDPGLVRSAQIGETISGPAYAEALLFARSALANKMVAFHQRYDLLLTPTLAVEAFEAGRNTPANGSFGDDWTAWTPFTYPFNITQQPAATVPCGLTRSGLPAGLQIVGPYGADELVLRAARAFEALGAFPTIDTPVTA